MNLNVFQPNPAKPEITAEQTIELLKEEHERSVDYICETIFSASRTFEQRFVNEEKNTGKGHSGANQNPFPVSISANSQSGHILEKTLVKIMEDYSVNVQEITDLHCSLVRNSSKNAQTEKDQSAHYFLILNNFKSCIQLLLLNAETLISSCLQLINMNNEIVVMSGTELKKELRYISKNNIFPKGQQTEFRNLFD